MPKSTKARGGLLRPARRRDELRRNLPKPTPGVRSLIRRPEIITSSLVLLAFAIVVSVCVTWSRDQVHVAAEQVMTETRVNRLDFTVENPAATEKAREEAQSRAPDVYVLDTAFLQDLRTPFHNLPVITSEQTEFEGIRAEIRETFALDEASLEALAAYANESTPTEAWVGWVDQLLDEVLPRYPLLDSKDWQRGLLEPEPPHLLGADGEPAANWNDAIRIAAGDDIEIRLALEQDLRPVVSRVGFPRKVVRYVVAGLASYAQPTYVKDVEATEMLAVRRSAEVEQVRVHHKEGDIIFRRGEKLNDLSLGVLKNEISHWRSDAPPLAIWLPRLGIVGLILVLTVFAGGFVLSWYRRILQNTMRLVAVFLLMATMLALTAVLAGNTPELLFLAAIAPTLFVATIVLLSYDQRLALFLSTVQCTLVALALGEGVAWIILLMAGCGTMIAQLREVRHRSSLLRAAIATAATLGVGTLFLGIFVGPPGEAIWLQILAQGAWAVVASLVVGFLVLGILPSIERLFDITTGMTLAELRDPSQPLLRQLQQRAPGTYNHSLQVANIAEAAAEAIGADSLLVYVGALYHDIGKMNKPEYFVENQTSGYNKHSKLRPAMSLLVIVGHVKDGIELGKEYGLPRALQHFIESHHGTTLVEYFYHAAKTEAETDEKSSVDEVEFRYPGPRPQSREAAILMLSDAVESATRAMSEPNPGRIESLVRELSRKRLLDGQFNDCDLTFRQLGLIEDAIIARVCAIHHGRIAYPTSRAEEVAAESA
ncbi:MAG: HDIG domain-containing protein [Planctomycetes bacterium]|nr:HDIG domain-containing protein [Planctomycetota bacterium]